jgi:hypothetical protein
MFKRLLPVLFALTALPGWATTTFYYTGAATSTESAFDTATGLLTTHTFTGETLSADTFSLANAASTGVSFYGFANVGNTTPVALSLVGSTLRETVHYTGDASLVVTLDSAIRSIGLHLTATGGATSFCFEAAATTTCGYTPSAEVLTSGATFFFGIISDSPIASFQIRNQSGSSNLSVQNFEVGSGASTPEPSTLALVGSGLVVLPFIARRKRRKL